jgi:integrase
MAGDGTLFQKKSNSKYYFIYNTGEKKLNKKGKSVPDQKWIDLETTDLTAAKEKVKLIRADLVKKGRYDVPINDSVEKWLDFWLNEIIKPKKSEDGGASTYDFYEYLIRVHIKPSIGKIPLKKLSPEDIQKFFNYIKVKKKLSKKKDEKGNFIPSNEPLSKRTIHGIEEVLSMALIKAVAMRKIPDNPMAGIDRIEYKRAKVKYMTGNQVAEFLDKIKYDPWYYVYLTTLGTGVRLSELAALKWDDVDLVNKKIQIDEGRVEVNTYAEEGPKTKIITKGPKSEEGNRIIPLPDDVVSGLKKWREIQIKDRWDWENKRLKEEERYAAGKFVHRKHKRPEYFQSGYVFTKPDGHPPRPSHLSKHFLELVREHGYEGLTFHKQRHSYASMLLEVGEDMKVIQENLGDATLQIVSDTYTHVAEALKKKAAQKLSGFTKVKNQ